ncbi:PREDICTED: vacuolar protein sorting-associated protein 72 homolog [Branchiostoma belcheri]|uniref:Vacuolar protein sorting-associated protein 72 homolog n=1 Tax=Branchiostoma belcheri TaxID=7741 RepID=A0A6P4YMP1_BRABE|nr:PREDICTED: vacuolar protein sorting-associated protein 72 homolog [Branchiostoma belcheri]
MAAERSRRVNAGAKMTKLLADEQEDEFYQTTYGGFTEESGDEEFESDAETSEDEVDSDFSASEDDEPVSDQEDDEPQRKRRVVTKAYREPKKAAKPSEKKEAEKGHQAQKVEKPKQPQQQRVIPPSARIQTRKSTAERTLQCNIRYKERERLRAIQPKKQPVEFRRLTQEELLEEAKITEQINLASLETYRQLEDERRKARNQKRVPYQGPTIRYHSLSMPLIEELPKDTEEINVVGDSSPPVQPSQKSQVTRCSRNFITFPDDATFRKHFPAKKPKPPAKSFCAVTRLPAKYFDPITQTPFATIQAFNCLRDTYLQEQELKCDKRLNELNGYLEQKRKQKLLQK